MTFCPYAIIFIGMPREHYSVLYKISDSEFAAIVKEAKSYADILRGVNLIYKGGNINTVKRRIALLKLNDSHIPKGMGSNKNRVFDCTRYTMEEAKNTVFIENSKIQRTKAKELLIRFELIPYKCKCGISHTWEGKPLSLQLEHMNGVHNDHRLENLCFLCPNCHSQTDTFAGKSTRRKYEEYDNEEFRNDCKVLKTTELKKKYGISETTLCKICRRLLIDRKTDQPFKRKVVRPSKEELEIDINKMPMTHVGKKYGVSDNAVRKWCKKFNIAL